MFNSTSTRGVLSVSCAVLFMAGSLSAQGFSDDFERADGPVDGWTIHQGEWNIAGGSLTTTSAAASQPGESWIWAGDPVAQVNGDFEATLDVNFVTASAEVGHHGGIMFFASVPTLRWDAPMNGYTIDWLGNGSGFRLIRWDAGQFSVLVGSTPQIAAPPSDWSLAVSGDMITFSAGGQTVFEFADGTHRQGHFGLWAYGTGQRIDFDNVVVSAAEPPVEAPAIGFPGLVALAALLLVLGIPLLRRSSWRRMLESAA